MRKYIITMPDVACPSMRLNPRQIAVLRTAFYNANEAVEVPVIDGQQFSVRFETNGEKTDWQTTKLYAVKPRPTTGKGEI